MKKIKILDIPFDNVTLGEAVRLAFEFIEEKRQALAITPNAEILQLCMSDKYMKAIALSAEIVLPDGEGVLLAAKAFGTPLKEKVAGVDFGFECAHKAAQTGKSIFLLGGKIGIAEKAAATLKKRFPQLRISGTGDGYFDKSKKGSRAIVKKINESKADILFLCLGAPRQEMWAHENRAALPKVKLIACLGGSLDVYAGKAKRAPKLFIKMRAEWLWRLLCQPKRITRIIKLPEFMISVYKHKKNLKKMRNIK